MRRLEKNGKARRPPGARALGSGGVPVVRASGLSQRGCVSRAGALPQPPAVTGAPPRAVAGARRRPAARGLSAALRAAAARGLAREPQAHLSALHRRGTGTTAPAATPPSQRDDPRASGVTERAERALGHGLHAGHLGGWPPRPDPHG